MKKPAILLMIAILMISLIKPYAAWAAEPAGKKALILYSLNQDFPFQALFTNGFKESMARQGHKVSYYYEHLDLPAHSTEASYQENLAKFLREKYADDKLDVIIVHSKPAADFMVKYGKAVFGDTPAIIAMIDQHGFNAENLPAGYTAVFGSFDIAKAVWVILESRPATKKIYVILGSSALEKKVQFDYNRQLAAMEKSVEIIYLSDLTFAEMQEKVKTVEKDSAILYTLTYADKVGAAMVPAKALPDICATAPVPVYGILDTYFGTGIVGGYMMSWEVLSYRVAEIAGEILQGKAIGEFPVKTYEAAVTRFDWRQFERWGIAEQNLPAGSIIDYKAPTFWELYFWHIAGVIVLLALETTLIILLLANIRRRKKAESALLTLNAQLETKVLQRTQELQEMNTTLEEEVMERQAAEAALQQANAMLETRVQERTCELQEMNAALEEEITERKILTEALQKSETRLQSILSAMPDAIFLFDKDTSLIDIHCRQDFILYMQLAMELKKGGIEAMPPEISGLFRKSVRQVLEQGVSPIIEFRVPDKGVMKTRETRFVKCGAEEVLAIVRDITEKKHDEVVENLFRKMTAKVIAEEPINIILQYACEHLVDEYGFSYCGVSWQGTDSSRHSAYVGKLFNRLLPDEGITPGRLNPEINWLTAAVLKSGKYKVAHSGEFPGSFREKAAAFNIQAVAAFPIRVKGKTAGVFEIFSENPDEFCGEKTVSRLENFAEQIAIAIAMAQDRQQLKLLTTGLKTTSNSITITDREGIIQWVNPAFCQRYNCSPGEAKGKKTYDLISFQQKPELADSIRAKVLNKQEWTGELITSRDDGSEAISQATITPILDESGEIVNLISVCHNITEIIQAQRAILEANEVRARAERLSSLGTMAAGISHEINQPLNSIKIISSGSLLQYEQGKLKSAAEYIESMREISRQTDAISNIISHLRSIVHRDGSRIESCDINTAVERALGIIGKQLANHGIAVSKRFQEKLPSVAANPTALEEVVINLLANAMQALDTVKKAEKSITIRTWFNNGVKLEIADNGPGIDPSLKQKIFEPFFSTKSGEGNLGLGLAIVNSIVTSYKGNIEIVSDGISGTSIRITFPA